MKGTKGAYALFLLLGSTIKKAFPKALERRPLFTFRRKRLSFYFLLALFTLYPTNEDVTGLIEKKLFYPHEQRSKSFPSLEANAIKPAPS